MIVHFSAIVADADFNARKLYDCPTPTGPHHTVDQLAADIERNGQTTPVLLMRRADGAFDLIAGFRRYRAFALIAERRGTDPGVKAEVVVLESLADAMALNLRENLHRADLRVWEIADRAAELIDKHGWTSARLASALGWGDAAYFDGLVRIVRAVRPDILAEWRAGHGAATLPFLARIAWDTHDAQEEAWRKACASPDEFSESGVLRPRQGGGGGRTPRGGCIHPGHVIDAATACKRALLDELDPVRQARLRGMVAALRFVLGETPSLDSLYDVRPKKVDTASTDAEDGAQ